jgi:MFS family permease
VKSQTDRVSAGDPDPYPSVPEAWAAVFVFFLATVISLMDRGLLALVIDPIRAELGISDVQISLLQGLAFALFYVGVGLPIGLLADRVSRRRLLIAGIFVWSLAAIGGGLARNFGEMFASRLAIGCGEAALAPCVVTMLGDLFPPNRRGRPMAIYVMASIVAQGFGSLVSGYILQVAPTGAFAAIPLLRDLAPWRIAFVVVGSAGFGVAGLVALLKEPQRRGIRLGRSTGLGVSQALGYWREHWRVLVAFYGILATYSFGTAVTAAWGPTLLTRVYHFEHAQAGKALGLAQILCSSLGGLVAGIVVDQVARRGQTRGKIAFVAVVALLALPCAFAAGAGQGTLAVYMLAEVTFVNAIFGTTMLSTITEIVPADMKGVSIALYAFAMSIVGGTLGPLAVAQLTQNVFRDPLAVGTPMAIVGGIGFVIAASIALVTARQFTRERGRSRAFAEVNRSNLA